MSEWGVNLISITDMDPTFKGLAVTLVGILALLFALWMVRRWKEPLRGGFLAFIVIAAFAVLYGSFILVAQPHWWNPPY